MIRLKRFLEKIKMKDVAQIQAAKIIRIDGKLPFSVVFLPKTNYGVKEENHILHDNYFLRTGEKRDEIIQKADEEFKKYGFKEGRYNPNWISGKLNFMEKEIVLEIDQSTLKGFNFWVPQGILGEFYEEKEMTFPKIRSDVSRTKKLFKRTFYDITDTCEMEEGLVDILRNDVKPCSVILTTEYLQKEKAWEAVKGRIPGDIQIMNYGTIWDRYTTYFEDPNTNQWSSLLNKEVLNENRKKLHKEMKIKIAIPHKLTKSDPYTFREMDKIPNGRGFLYFDGSLEDIFLMLKESGVEIT